MFDIKENFSVSIQFTGLDTIIVGHSRGRLILPNLAIKYNPEHFRVVKKFRTQIVVSPFHHLEVYSSRGNIKAVGNCGGRLTIATSSTDRSPYDGTLRVSYLHVITELKKYDLALKEVKDPLIQDDVAPMASGTIESAADYQDTKWITLPSTSDGGPVPVPTVDDNSLNILKASPRLTLKHGSMVRPVEEKWRIVVNYVIVLSLLILIISAGVGKLSLYFHEYFHPMRELEIPSKSAPGADENLVITFPKTVTATQTSTLIINKPASALPVTETSTTTSTKRASASSTTEIDARNM
ncbi:hypothetical protein DXG01_004322 [Tephrocybe rancida]|nr:hypothetical protein DXG01_004322 [Tephrocybe rancida]